MTQEEWDYLYQERVAIMHFDGGMMDSEAREKAWFDTVSTFGKRPTKQQD